MEFGIARITDSNKTGMVFGALSYLSPKQLISNKIDSRSDLLSSGIMVFSAVAAIYRLRVI